MKFKGGRIKLAPQVPAETPAEQIEREGDLAAGIAPGTQVVERGALPPAGADVRLVHDAETNALVIRFEIEGEVVREIRCPRGSVLELLGAGDLNGLSMRVDGLVSAARAIVEKYDADQHGDIRGIDEQIEAIREALR